MTCDRGHERVHWRGDDVPCWVCGSAGVRSRLPTIVGHRNNPEARPHVPERLRL